MEWIDCSVRLPDESDYETSTDSVGDVVIRYWVGPGEKHVEVSTVCPFELRKKHFASRQVQWLSGWNTPKPEKTEQ